MKETEKLLEIRHLHKDYGEGTILNDVSLDIHKGEVVVLIGPSGCGKSTFLRCINGLEPIQSGEICLDGENISEGKTKWSEVRQKIGMVFQSYDLFPHMTVMDNILLGPTKVQKRNKKEAEAEAEKLLERVGLLERKDAYPRQLSGGQKQRVAIARALAMEPEILLFDEPTSALDPQMVGEVLEVMRDLAHEGLTMIIVTHEMAFARDVSKRVIFMANGIIVEDRPPKELFETPKDPLTKEFLSRFRNA